VNRISFDIMIPSLTYLLHFNNIFFFSLFFVILREKKERNRLSACVSEWVHDDHNYNRDGSDDDHNYNYNDKVGTTRVPRVKITDRDDVIYYDLLLSIFSHPSPSAATLNDFPHPSQSLVISENADSILVFSAP
jgi:hypothetical protein